MLILNLKTYPESSGENLNRILEDVSEFINENPNTSDKLLIAPPTVSLGESKFKFPNLNIISQDVDTIDEGASTGSIPPESLISDGVNISIFNHSERRANWESIVEDIRVIQSRRVNLIVCCENMQEAEVILGAAPFAIAYEPKDLIGSGTSVTTRPEAVEGFINLTKGKAKIIIGAGVTTSEDISKALELGAEGVLLSSSFVKASDHKTKLAELIAPFLNTF